MSDIERIRQMVEGVRKLHAGPRGYPTDCRECDKGFMCPHLALAEKVLVLAEALNRITPYVSRVPHEAQLAERALSEAAK